MKNKAYIGLFKSDKDDLSEKEITETLNLELESKNPDTGLIKDCLDTLDEMKSGKAYPKPIRKHFAVKAVFAAAAILILISGTLVSAKVFDFDLKNSLAELYSDRIRISHNENLISAGSDLSDTVLAEKLSENGIYPVLLPEKLTDGTYSIDSLTFEKTDCINSALIAFSDGEINGTMVINVYSDGVDLPVTDYGEAENISILTTEKATFYIFEQENSSVIDFSYSRAVCSVILNSDLEFAAAFAANIK